MTARTAQSRRRATAAQPGSARTRDAHAEDRAALCEVTCLHADTVSRARDALAAHADLPLLAETFRALGDPTRLRILAALAAPDVGELCVCDLAAVVDASESAVSHSLRTLRQLRLVRYRKVGKIAYYALDDAHVSSLLAEGFRHVEEHP